MKLSRLGCVLATTLLLSLQLAPAAFSLDLDQYEWEKNSLLLVE